MNSENKKKVGIVLVNYKDYAKRFLSACAKSLARQDYGRENYQIYIVDNASSQESRDDIKNIYPEAIILERKNGNYSAANNLGFKQAILDRCQYLVTLNMDVELETDWLSHLVKVLESDKEVGIVQSKILLYSEDKMKKINTLGNKLHFLGFGYTSAYGEEDREIAGSPEIKGYASGCCFITSREVYEELGGWDNLYYMYHDDIEFSLKARLLGYKLVLAPQSIVYHKYEFSRSVRMLYYMERNRYILMFSFYPILLIILLIPALIILDLFMAVYALVKGWFKTWLFSRLYFLNPFNWYRIYRVRRKVRKVKKKSFSEIIPSLEGGLDFLEIDNPILKYIANPLMIMYWSIVKRLI